MRLGDLPVTAGVVLVRDNDKWYNHGAGFAVCSHENWLDMDSIWGPAEICKLINICVSTEGITCKRWCIY